MSNLPALRRRLLAWFRVHARSLPWRADRDPYRIWVSEVMLQQTQVATVIPFFERFLKRFPTLGRLAAADEHAVLQQWEGLGYYRRARDLWRAARQMRADRHSAIPDDADYVRTLPGFGRYTTNAVLSQAYDRRLPILEANSQRVLCRLFGIEENPKEPAVQRDLWQRAETILPNKSVGDFNQAVMELGALVCAPMKPRCAACPIQAHCQARQENRQHLIPLRASRPQTLEVAEVAIVVRSKGKLLLVQRPDVGRWAHMWEFPHHPLEWMESHESAADRLLKSLGLRGTVRGEIATIRHSVTHHRITMACLLFERTGGSLHSERYRDAAWVPLLELPSYPLSVSQRRLAQRVAELQW
jgi:A/G-specific adenine glycosylase